MQQRRAGPRGRGSNGVSPRAPRRGLYWDDTIIDKSLATGAQTSDSLLQGVPSDEIKGMTVTRLIMSLWMIQLTAGTGSTYAGGIYVVEDDAFAAAAMADPGEVGDDAGWLWRVMQVPVVTSVVNDSTQFTRFAVDLRAQRKFPGEDYTLVLVQQNTGGPTFNLDGYVRTLCKRP